MPSRRPPSLRNEGNSTERIGGTLQQIFPGARTRNAQPVKQQTVSRVASSGGDSTHAGTGSNTVQVGTSANAAGNDSTSLGVSSQTLGAGTVAVGSGATSYAPNSITIGAASSDLGTGAPGNHGYYAVLIGAGATVPSGADGAVAVGPLAAAVAGSAVAVGFGAHADTSSVAVGPSSSAATSSGVAIGYAASVEYPSGGGGGGSGVAVGPFSRATATGAGAYGPSALSSIAHQAVFAYNAVEVGSGSATSTALILRDSSGARWAVTVSTSGTLAVAPA